jgi:hypothetical protein
MRSRLYVEASVISYLTSRPSRDVIALAHQKLTRELRFVMETCRAANYEPPIICTPEELTEE